MSQRRISLTLTEDQCNTLLDAIDMVTEGLQADDVKRHYLTIRARIQTSLQCQHGH